MKIIKEVSWEMAHRLSSYNGKCQNLHGHHYSAEICIEGHILVDDKSPENGMLIDFGILLDLVNKVISEKLDHSCIVYQNDTVLIDFYSKNPGLKHLIVPFPSTVENITKWLYEQVEQELPNLHRSNISLAWVRVRETPTSTAFYDHR